MDLNIGFDMVLGFKVNWIDFVDDCLGFMDILIEFYGFWSL